jgi:hypothetical protein
MARLFNALVVVGSGISAAACGGQSVAQEENDGGRAGNDGRAGAGGAGNDAGGASGAGTAGTGAGGAGNGGLGGAGSSGAASGAGNGAASGDGTGGTGSVTPNAQWNCSGYYDVCEAVNGTTAARLTSPCPLEPDRPTTAEDCGANQRLTCYQATLDGNLGLVNCECADTFDNFCSWCTGIDYGAYGDPASCDDQLKVCACAYTGILR